MAYNPVNVGIVPNDGTGDDLRDAFIKINAMFEELYTFFEQVTSLEGILGSTAGETGVLALSNLPNTGGGDYNIAPPTEFLSYIAPFAAGAGSGAYNQNICLSAVNCQSGSVLYVKLAFTGNNGTINIYDNNSATGTQLQGGINAANGGGSTNYLFVAYFDGAAWNELSGQWV